MHYRYPLLTCILWLCCLAPRLPAGENMIGRQSQNEGLPAVPAPGQVSIDGDLKDWDFSGRIWVFADQNVRNRYSVEMAAMWDATNLYLAAKWHDPTPMCSSIDPAFNPSNGWRADSIQMRVRTADQTSWLTTWYFSARRQPVLHQAVWKDPDNERKGTVERLFIAPEGGRDLGEGLAMAYRRDEDGKGFVQELCVPWTKLYHQPPAAAAGNVLRIGFEFLWGDPAGARPVHRYADNMQPGTTSREFYWSAWKSWGNVTLMPKGKLEPRRYVSDTDRVEGAIPLRVTVPAKAARVTVVIDDATGKRVRNLAGDLLPEDYTVAQTESTRTLEVPWDGLDDKNALVQPGTYRVRGLSHEGLGSEYELSFYNPGTPPWPTADHRGAWGADHTPPLRAAAAGDWTILSWAFAEGGDGLIGIGPDGLKKWGEKRGATCLAADEGFVYGVPASWHIKKNVLIRLGRDQGDYRPFVKDGQERSFELPFAEILGSDAWKPLGLQATPRQLVVLLAASDPQDGPASTPAENAEAGTPAQTAKCRIAFLDKTSAVLERQLDTRPLTAIAVAADGQLYGIDNTAAYRLDAHGQAQALSLPSLAQPRALTLDRQGNLVIVDAGPDQQIKAYTPAGKLVYTCGKKGGRPIRGDFDPQAMRAVSSIAVDHRGQVWAVESWSYPRRVSLWNPQDGKLLRDYIGNTGYAGTGAYLHDSNPELAYLGPIEMKLDRVQRQWQVSRILWVPDEAAGEVFAIDPGSHANCQRFTATVAGKAREYLFRPPYRDYEGYVIYMETPRGWQPVSAVSTAGTVAGKFGRKGVVEEAPDGEFAGLDPMDGVFWNDANGDGKVQRAECQIVKAETPAKGKKRAQSPLPLGSGWGERIAPDFTFYTNGLAAYKPLRFTAAGAPVYGPESIVRLPADDQGVLIPVPQENLLLCLSWKGYSGPTRLVGYDVPSGRERWSYPNPYPGVHGSHRATMPRPGLLIGPLKIAGVADVGGEAGRVFVLRGNLGQDFFMTTDGLFVGAMFQDGRLPSEELPSQEAALVGQPMEGFTHGSEPFNGWFGKQADGRIRMTTGFPRQAAMILAVNGLESVRRFAGPEIALDAAQIAAADAHNQQRVARDQTAKVYTVQRAAKTLRIDGNDGDWQGLPGLDIKRLGSPFTGNARLACDDHNLYLFYRVKDDSPWRNEGKDFTRLFKTGDAVDLQLCTAEEATAGKRANPGPNDLRVVFGQVGKKPVAVLMKPVDKTAPPTLAVDYSSPVGTKHFDRVELLQSAKVAAVVAEGGYTVEAALPLAALGITLKPGLRLRADLGFISSDAAGSINVARTYWANRDTNLVSDLPQEAWFKPDAWGTLLFAASPETK